MYSSDLVLIETVLNEFWSSEGAHAKEQSEYDDDGVDEKDH